jgi:hypothetical protein
MAGTTVAGATTAGAVIGGTIAAIIPISGGTMTAAGAAVRTEDRRVTANLAAAATVTAVPIVAIALQQIIRLILPQSGIASGIAAATRIRIRIRTVTGIGAGIVTRIRTRIVTAIAIRIRTRTRTSIMTGIATRIRIAIATTIDIGSPTRRSGMMAEPITTTGTA